MDNTESNRSLEFPTREYKVKMVQSVKDAQNEFRVAITTLPTNIPADSFDAEVAQILHEFQTLPIEQIELLLQGGIACFIEKHEAIEKGIFTSMQPKEHVENRRTTIAQVIPLLEQILFERINDELNPPSQRPSQQRSGAIQLHVDRGVAQQHRLTQAIVLIAPCGESAANLVKRLVYWNGRYGSAIAESAKEKANERAASTSNMPAASLANTATSSHQTMQPGTTSAPIVTTHLSANNTMFGVPMHSTPLYSMPFGPMGQPQSMYPGTNLPTFFGGWPYPLTPIPQGMQNMNVTVPPPPQRTNTPAQLQVEGQVQNGEGHTSTQPTTSNAQTSASEANRHAETSNASSEANSTPLDAIQLQIANLESVDTTQFSAQQYQDYKLQYELLLMKEKRHKDSVDKEKKERDHKRPKLTVTTSKDIEFTGRKRDRFEGDFELFLTHLNTLNPHMDYEDHLALIVRSLTGPARDLYDTLPSDVQTNGEKLKNSFLSYFRKRDKDESIRAWHDCKMSPSESVDHFHHHTFSKKLADYVRFTGAVFTDQTKKLEFHARLTHELQERMMRQHSAQRDNAGFTFEDYFDLAIKADDGLKQGAPLRQKEFAQMARQCGLNVNSAVLEYNLNNARAKANGEEPKVDKVPFSNKPQFHRNKRQGPMFSSRGQMRGLFRKTQVYARPGQFRQMPQFRQPQATGWQDRGNISAKTDSSGTLRQNNTWGNDPVSCHTCGKRGHYAVNCPTKGTNPAAKPAFNSNQNTGTQSGQTRGGAVSRPPYRGGIAQRGNSYDRNRIHAHSRFMICPVDTQCYDDDGNAYYGNQETEQYSDECFAVDDQGMVYCANADPDSDMQYDQFPENNEYDQDGQIANCENDDESQAQGESVNHIEGSNGEEKVFKIIALNTSKVDCAYVNIIEPTTEDDPVDITTRELNAMLRETRRSSNDLQAESLPNKPIRWRHHGETPQPSAQGEQTARKLEYTPTKADLLLASCLGNLNLDELDTSQESNQIPKGWLNKPISADRAKGFIVNPQDTLETLIKERGKFAKSDEDFANIEKELDHLYKQEEIAEAMYTDWPSYPLVFGNTIVEDPLFDTGAKKSFISMKALLSLAALDEQGACALLMMRKNVHEPTYHIGKYRNVVIIGQVMLPCKLQSKVVMIKFNVAHIMDSKVFVIGMNGLKEIDMHFGSANTGNWNLIRGPRKEAYNAHLAECLKNAQRIAKSPIAKPCYPSVYLTCYTYVQHKLSTSDTPASSSSSSTAATGNTTEWYRDPGPYTAPYDSNFERDLMQ